MDAPLRTLGTGRGPSARPIPFGAYGRSKTANILFAVEFDRRHKANGVRATAVHPGGIQTELARHLSLEVIQQMIGKRSAGALVS